MKSKSKATNEGIQRQVDFLRTMAKDKHARIWGDLAKRVASSRRRRAELNVSRLGRYTKADQTVAVPGKVLGAGRIGHAVTVAALSFSTSAREKVVGAGGKCLSYEELLRENPKGSNVMIMRGL